jgi:two-component system, NarL family, sensor kinase
MVERKLSLIRTVGLDIFSDCEAEDFDELRRRLIDGRELQQLYLAHQLHEGILQDLYSLSFLIESLDLRATEENKKSSEFAAIQENISLIVAKLRRICNELRPPTLGEFGLEKAIRSHVENVMEQHPEIEVKLNISNGVRLLPPRIRLALFRVYQQAMSNAIKYSDTRNIEVVFLWDAEQVVLEVFDDGKGFEVPDRWIDLARQGQLGLVAAAERCGAIGGVFTVESQPGFGTRVRVLVPADSIGWENE